MQSFFRLSPWLIGVAVFYFLAAFVHPADGKRANGGPGRIGITSNIAFIDRPISEFETIDEVLQQRNRLVYGHTSVVRVAQWVDQFRSGDLSTAEFVSLLYLQNPRSTVYLLSAHGEVSDLFLLEAIALEAEAPIGRTPNGEFVFFDTTRFVNESSLVLFEFEDAFQSAVNANDILRRAYAAHPQLRSGKMLSNHCCKRKQQALCHCAAGAGFCGPDEFNTCKPTSTNCGCN